MPNFSQIYTQKDCLMPKFDYVSLRKCLNFGILMLDAINNAYKKP